jgi:hypothetical protein
MSGSGNGGGNEPPYLATVGSFIHDTLRQSNDQLVLVIYIATATEAGFVPGSL